MHEIEPMRQHGGQGDLKRKLGRAMLHFQDRLLEANITPGSLCQVQFVKHVTRSDNLAWLVKLCFRACTASFGCCTALVSIAMPHLLGAVATVICLPTYLVTFRFGCQRCQRKENGC